MTQHRCNHWCTVRPFFHDLQLRFELRDEAELDAFMRVLDEVLITYKAERH